MKKQIYNHILILLLINIGVLFFYSGPTDAEFRKSKRWSYLVIHHSGTRIGSLSIFNTYHKQRGMRNGAAYHFIIDNGTASRADGQIEVSQRWKRQIEGGHCRIRRHNQIGIGICLVGNFNKTRPTKKQMESLFALMKLLRDQYDIPVSRIVGHGEMKGEQTDCPGKNFSMKSLRKMVSEKEKQTK